MKKDHLTSALLQKLFYLIPVLLQRMNSIMTEYHDTLAL